MQDSRSIGAIAGLAFTIVFAWRILRTSSPQRRSPKRQAVIPGSSGVSSHFSENIATSEVSPPSEDSSAQNVIDEFFQPVKVEKDFHLPLPLYPNIIDGLVTSTNCLQPTLGQIVRQRLSEGRKVSFNASLVGISLTYTSPSSRPRGCQVHV